MYKCFTLNLAHTEVDKFRYKVVAYQHVVSLYISVDYAFCMTVNHPSHKHMKLQLEYI